MPIAGDLGWRRRANAAVKGHVRRCFEALGFHVERRTDPRLTLAHFLRHAFPKGQQVRFIQVGAHDATRNDPISLFRRHLGWEGLLFEANPRVFERLKRNLADASNCRAVNYAIAERSGRLDFYVIREPQKTNSPAWADQVSSLDRQHVLRFLESWGHTNEEACQLIETVAVEARSFEDALSEFDVDQVDLLFLDAEGLDFRLLSGFPFERVRPELIILEFSHLTQHELAQIPRFFADRSYAFYFLGEDLIARRWR